MNRRNFLKGILPTAVLLPLADKLLSTPVPPKQERKAITYRLSNGAGGGGGSGGSALGQGTYGSMTVTYLE